MGDGRAIGLFGNAAEIGKERVACGFIAQERTAAVLGAEDEMYVNGGKGLWHARRIPNRKRFANVNVSRADEIDKAVARLRACRLSLADA